MADLVNGFSMGLQFVENLTVILEGNVTKRQLLSGIIHTSAEGKCILRDFQSLSLVVI